MLSLKEHGHQYQIDTIRQIIRNDELGLFVDMGLGKTMMMLHALAYWKRQGELKGALIVCPILVAYNTWPAEIKNWMSTQGLTFSIVHGNSKKARLNKDVDIHITNFESLPWLHKELTKRKKFPWDTLIVDESTKLKDPTTNRFKKFRHLIKLFERRYILTATPIAQHLKDIWAQWYLVENGQTFGDNFNKWLRENFHNYSTDFRYKMWKPLPGTKQKIQEEIRPKVIRLKAKDHLKLPPFMSIQTKVEFPKHLADKYLELKNESVYISDETELIVDNEALVSDKCRQFTQGAVYTDPETGEFETVHTIKLDMLESKLDSLMGQRRALVAINYWFEAVMIAERFPDCFIIAGNNRKTPKNIIKSSETPRVLEKWNAGKLPYLFVHPASVSHGLNLQGGGDYLLFYSMPFSLDQYLQLIGRLLRQGQKNAVTADHLMITNGKDPDIWQGLGDRYHTQEDVLDYLNGDIPDRKERNILI